MYVAIDPAEKEDFLFWTTPDVHSSWTQKRIARSSARSLLEALVLLLEEVGEKLTTLQGIAVRLGHGSFTADRVAVTTINMLVLSLRIPAVSVDVLSSESLAAAFKNAQGGQYLAAQYSGEPNVVSKKK
jgi:tRNA A37 threonylcarbamoyladenosine modification protein TsaB